ncbi:MAG: methionine--tRNA ligase [Pseudomonadales bacterium]|nr:methionine--tRNA ligase [Pseudomonadales bacterium]MCP5182411.1 methionine--tRNA ligase [Pseudomonadales bacterium]
MPRRIFVTSALPYANGQIHLGHLLEHIQTDIWVRFQRMRGNQVIYVCADDTHGTATMLRAEAEGITPETYIDRLRADHVRDFQRFQISHDNYYSTHSPENRELAEFMYNAAKAAGRITTSSVQQLYDPEKKLFLADRFVRGACPRCKTPDQPGDNCDACGATYAATDLEAPRSALSGATPVLRESEHYFFDVAPSTELLRNWLASSTQPEVANKLKEWLDAGLKPWDISRDAPYFGFLIPGTTDKYFYVWLDAPIGYMASLRNLLSRRNDFTFEEFWDANATGTEVHHFVGKDIINFHCLFWPALLTVSGFRRPTRVHVHGFVTVDGTKMSKSRGTFIEAGTYLEHLRPEYLRYYYAAKLNGTVDDIDINLDDFVQRVNSDLVGKLVNIASRCAGFISKQFSGRLAPSLPEPALFDELASAADSIAACYEADDTARAVREIMALADRANQYVAQAAPWTLAKDPDRAPEVQAICTQGLNLFRQLLVYIKPILPAVAEAAENFLNVPPLAWTDASTPLLNHAINPYAPLLTRLERAAIDRMVDASRATPSQAQPVAGLATGTDDNKESNVSEKSTISIDDFAKVQLKVARILEASAVEGADKLLQLRLDLGDHQRTVFSGIKSAYDPANLVGRLTVVVANLAPRKMRFGTSEGMVLAAGPGGSDIFLIAPDTGAQPGMDVT